MEITNKARWRPNILCKYSFSDFHRGKVLFCRLLSFGTVQPCRFIRTFQRKTLSSFFVEEVLSNFQFLRFYARVLSPIFMLPIGHIPYNSLTCKISLTLITFSLNMDVIFFNHENGGSKLLRNLGVNLHHYMASKPINLLLYYNIPVQTIR